MPPRRLELGLPLDGALLEELGLEELGHPARRRPVEADRQREVAVVEGRRCGVVRVAVDDAERGDLVGEAEVRAVAGGEAAVERGHRQDVLAVPALVRRHERVEPLEEPRLPGGVGDRVRLVPGQLVRLDALALGEDVVRVLVDGRHRVEVRRLRHRRAWGGQRT